MALAISIDYSLFMFTRYQKELRDSNNDPMEAIPKTVFHAGHVIVMSGCCLIVSFCGFLLLDCAFITGIAIGNSITIILCIVVSVTSTPAFLYLFPSFFAAPFERTVPKFVLKLRRKKTSTSEDMQEPMIKDGQTSSNLETIDLRSSDAIEKSSNITSKEDHEKLRKSWWYKITKFTTSHPYNYIVLIVCYGLAGACAYRIFDLKITTNFTVGIPHNADAYKALMILDEEFGSGVTQPFYMLQVPVNSKETVTNNEFFAAGFNMMATLVNRTALIPSSFQAMTAQLDSTTDTQIPLTWDEASALLETDPVYAYQWTQQVNPLNNSMLYMITVPFDPNSYMTKGFVEDVYHALDTLDTSKYKYYFCGFKVYEADTVMHAWNRFPLMIVFTIGIVFVLMALFLKSAFVPVRLLFTLGVPVATTYGIAVGVYQDGWLAWTGIDTFSVAHDGFYWDIPVITFSIIVGLALDYDCFLLTRIAEYRVDGYNAKASVLKGVHDTAGIITAAGIIMSLAFSTMLTMSEMAVRQTGWLLTSSVILDTFVVRTIVVPAVMSLADRFGWWPRKIPTTGLMNEFDEVDENERSRLRPGESS
jgi:RND superfamily putative drug exporter